MRLTITLMLALAVPATAAYADGIVNPDFDGAIGTAPAAPWISSGGVQIWPFNQDPGANSQVARLGLAAGNLATLAQTFDCGEASGGMACTVSLWIVWTPNTADPEGDESFEILDDGNVVYSLEFGDGFMPLTHVVLDFGACGSQSITFQVSDPTGDTLDSWAYVDGLSCSCAPPVSVETRTWSAIKTLYQGD